MPVVDSIIGLFSLLELQKGALLLQSPDVPMSEVIEKGKRVVRIFKIPKKCCKYYEK